MKQYIIYIHTNLINGKVYIGQTCRSLETRSGLNGKGYYNSPHFYKSIVKYGWENFSHEILKDNLSAEEANFYEKFYIKQYDSTNPDKGYNILSGGTDCFQQIEPFKYKKGHISSRKRRVICVETGEVFDSIKSASNWSGTTNSHITLNCQGKRYHAGRNPDTKQQVSWKYYDQNDNIIGKKCLKPLQQKQYNIKNIICVNTGEVFENASVAALKKTGKKSNASSILKCCNGERQSCGKDKNGNKLKWKYVQEE